MTKYVSITSYEHHTVTLPCEIQNLPNDMHVIWQYGKRGEANQTVLTVGGTQLETNYRVRVISNSSDSDDDLRVTTHNLEIRKLQSSDSGWYECQLPTKPTQINYVYLEVLALPRIEVSTRHARVGETIELMCQVKNLPRRFELSWVFNDKKLNLEALNRFEDNSTRTQANGSMHFAKNRKAQKILKTNYYINRRSVVNQRKKSDHLDTYLLINDRIQNTSVSRLRIRDLSELHRGLYKCRYDKVEARYHLEVKSSKNGKINLNENKIKFNLI